MKKDSMWQRLGVYLLLSAAVLFISSMITGYYHVYDGVLSVENFSSFDLLLSQIANTFIVLSLTSVLSTNIGSIYWEDIKDVKLVTPYFQCFYALTTYLLTAMVFSIASYSLGFESGVCTSFIISVLLLLFLTFKMIGIYFGRDHIKHQLIWDYYILMIDNASHYECEASLKRITKLMDEGKIKTSNKRRKEIKNRQEKLKRINLENDPAGNEQKQNEYNRRTRELKEKVLQALCNNDLKTVQENIELLLLVEDWRCLYDMMDSIVIMNPNYAVDMLAKIKKEVHNTYIMEQIVNDAKAILHNLVGNQYTHHLIQRLLGIIGESEANIEKNTNMYKELSELRSSFASDVYKINAEEYDPRGVLEAERALMSQAENDLKRILEKYDNIVVGKVYKPVSEMYDAYLRRDLNLFSLYLTVLKEDIEFIDMGLRAYIVDFLKDNTVELKYLNEEQNKLVDTILVAEKDDRILPENVIRELQFLRKIIISK